MCKLCRTPGVRVAACCHSPLYVESLQCCARGLVPSSESHADALELATGIAEEALNLMQ